MRLESVAIDAESTSIERRDGGDLDTIEIVGRDVVRIAETKVCPGKGIGLSLGYRHRIGDADWGPVGEDRCRSSMVRDFQVVEIADGKGLEIDVIVRVPAKLGVGKNRSGAFVDKYLDLRASAAVEGIAVAGVRAEDFETVQFTAVVAVGRPV